ncbi:MAG: hypothetical protein SFU83_06185 [Meiothermus sp.]|nr:hypothetical protein [Meiothermus sp.]
MQSLLHPHLPVQASEGAVLRGKAMQEYLLQLREALQTYRDISPVHLLVLNEADWASRVKSPYGFAFQRTSLKEGLYLFLPKHYPDRLLWRLREVLVPAIRAAGVRAPSQPGDFLDLNLGHEYAHAVAVTWGLRTRVKWVDEFLANYLFLLALRVARPDLYPVVKAWNQIVARLTPRETSLGSYGSKPKGLVDQLWFQGQFTLEADRLVEEKGDELLRGLLSAAPLKKSTVHKLLVGLEPGLKEWFASFAPQRQKLSQAVDEPVGWDELGGQS